MPSVPRRPAPSLALAAALAAALAPSVAGAGEEAADEAVEVWQHGGRCQKALVRGDDWTVQCAPMAVRARYRDGHQTVLFFIQGAAELSFHVFKEYRKEAGLHVLLVDQLRLKKARHVAPGYCMVRGTFTHPSRLEFAAPVEVRCRAGTPADGDLADITFRAEPAKAEAAR